MYAPKVPLPVLGVKSAVPFVPPRDGAKTANVLSPQALLVKDSVIISGLYPPSPKTLTTVTVPAERKYCCTVYGV